MRTLLARFVCSSQCACVVVVIGVVGVVGVGVVGVVVGWSVAHE